MDSICKLGRSFPKTSSNRNINDLKILDGRFDINKGKEHMIVNLFLFNKYSRFIQRHRVLVPLLVSSASNMWIWTGGHQFSFVHILRLEKLGPVGLSRPPWLGLASCTSLRSASRLSARPRPSDPEGTDSTGSAISVHNYDLKVSYYARFQVHTFFGRLP